MRGLIDEVASVASMCNSIRYALDTDHAYYLWENSSSEQKDILRQAVTDRDIQTVRGWLRKHPERTLEYYTTTELIALAREHQIPNYSRILKEDLIEEIRHAQGGNA